MLFGKLHSTHFNVVVRCLVCKGDSIVIPNTIDTIYTKAFYGTEFSEIVIPKTVSALAMDAFENSKWERIQTKPIVINGILFKANCGGSTLVVPKGVKKFHPDLFWYSNVPRKLVCNFMPPLKNIKPLLNVRSDFYCKTLELTSPNVNLDLNVLREFVSLGELVLAEGHKRYKTIDGVLYSNDGKTLVFYPKGKRDVSFTIPDGVESIAAEAFAKNSYLENVVMPDSVKSIGASAFFNCTHLRSIHFSSNLEEIPDSNTFNQGGVFQYCGFLSSVVLPEKLKYLGDFAFYDSGLTSITLNDQLEFVGDYALSTPSLDRASLPASIKRLGRGSLCFVTNVEAYEGTARNLISAINAVEPEEKDAIVNLKWHSCKVVVLHRDRKETEDFLIPQSLNRNAAYRLDLAWNQSKMDYSEYEECLLEIKEPDEKMEVLSKRLLYHAGDGKASPFFELIKSLSFKLAVHCLENKKEDAFLVLLRSNLLSSASLQKLLKLSNERGMVMYSAYIAEQQTKQKRSKRGYRL